MTLLKVEGVNNEVFIPDQISDEDKSFLVERTENIVGIVTRAKVEIGIELLKVEQRFRDKREFGGPKGWYQQWYKSVGISEQLMGDCVKRARIATLCPSNTAKVELLPCAVVGILSEPNVNGGKAGKNGGASDELVKYTVDTLQGATRSELVSAKDSPLNQVLVAERVYKKALEKEEKAHQELNEGPSRQENLHEYEHLHKKLNKAKTELKTAESRLNSLATEKAALEAKYEDWRSPEAIKQEFEEAIAKARAEEQAKKVEVKTVVETVVDETALKVANQATLEAKKEALELKQQLEELQHQIELANKAKEDAEREKRTALREKKHITERFNDLHQQHQNPVDAKLILTGIHMRFIEMEKDANSYKIIEPNYQPRQFIINNESCFVSMVKAWLPIIAEDKFDEIAKAVDAIRDSVPEPMDYIDTTAVTY